MRRDSITVRSWILETADSDDIEAKLLERRGHLDARAAILRPVVERLLPHQLEHELHRVEQRFGPIPDQARRELKEDLPTWLDYAFRITAEAAVASYYSQHPDPEGFTLPVVTVGVYPWGVPPATVHSLDLKSGVIDLVFDALAAQRADLERLASASLKAVAPDSENAVAVALAQVRLFKERARRIPMVRAVEDTATIKALRAPTRTERERADRLREAIHRARGPHFPRDVQRREDLLALLLNDYNALKEKVAPLHDELVSTAPSPVLLNRFKVQMGRSTLTRQDLAQWARLDLRTVLLVLLGKYPSACQARELLEGTSLKTRRDLLRLAERAVEINERWSEFVKEKWSTCNPEDRQALFPSRPPVPDEVSAPTRLYAAIVRGDEAAFPKIAGAIAALPGGPSVLKGIRAGQIPEATALGILQFYRLVPNDAAREYVGRWVRWYQGSASSG